MKSDYMKTKAFGDALLEVTDRKPVVHAKIKAVVIVRL